MKKYILSILLILPLLIACEQQIAPTGELAEKVLENVGTDEALSSVELQRRMIKNTFKNNKSFILMGEDGRDISFLPMVEGETVKVVPSIPFLPDNVKIDVSITYKVLNSKYAQFDPSSYSVKAVREGQTMISFKADFNYNDPEIENDSLESNILVYVMKDGNFATDVQFISVTPTSYLTLAPNEAVHMEFKALPLGVENSKISYLVANNNIATFKEEVGKVVLTGGKLGKTTFIAYSQANPNIYKVVNVEVKENKSQSGSQGGKDRTGVKKLNLSADPFSLIASYDVTHFKAGNAAFQEAKKGSELRVNADASQLGKGLIYIQIYLMVDCKPAGILKEKVLADYPGIPEIFSSLGAKITGDYNLEFTLDSAEYPDIVAAGLVKEGETLILNLDKNKNLSMGAKLGDDLEYNAAGKPLVDNMACSSKDRTGVKKLNLSADPFSLIAQYELKEYKIGNGNFQKAIKGSELRVNADASKLGQGYILIPMYLKLDGREVGFLERRDLEGTDIPGIFGSLGAEIASDYELIFTLDSKKYPAIVAEGLVKGGETLVLKLDVDRNMSMGAGLGNDIVVDASGKPIVDNSNVKDPKRVASIILDKEVVSPSVVVEEEVDGEEVTEKPVTKENEQIIISATVLPATAENKTLIWSSADDSIATVRDGVITIKDPQRSTTITVKSADNESITASVTVSVPVSKIEVTDGTEWNPTKDDVGKTKQINATAKPETAAESARKLTFTSNNSSVASVDQNGLITLHKNGAAIITISVPNTELKVEYRVNPYPEKIIFDEFEGGKCNNGKFQSSGQNCSDNEYEYTPYNEGDTFFLDTLMYDGVGNLINSESGITWSSDNNDIATVENGVVKILKNGNATITAKYGDTETKLYIRGVTETTTLKGFTLAQKEKNFVYIDEKAFNEKGVKVPEIKKEDFMQEMKDLIIVQPSILNSDKELREKLIKEADFKFQLIDEVNERKAKLVESSCENGNSADLNNFYSYSIFCIDNKSQYIFEDESTVAAVVVKANIDDGKGSTKELQKVFLANIIKKAGKIIPVTAISVEGIGEEDIDKSTKRFFFEVGKGNVGKIRPKVSPENADNKELEFKVTSGESVTVDENSGEVKITDKSGISEITVSTVKEGSDNKKKIAKITISVARYPSKINFELNSPGKYAHGVGDGTKIVSPKIEASADADRTLIYTSSNQSVATVSENSGAVSCVKPGISTITARTVNNLSASYTLECYTVPDIKNPSTLAGTYDIIQFASDAFPGIVADQYVGTITKGTNKYKGSVQRMMGEVTIAVSGNNINMRSRQQMHSSVLNTPQAGVNVSHEQFARTQFRTINYSGGANTFGQFDGTNINTVQVEKDPQGYGHFKLTQKFKKDAGPAKGIPVIVSTYIKKRSDTVHDISNDTCYFNQYNGGNANIVGTYCKRTSNEPHRDYGVVK